MELFFVSSLLQLGLGLYIGWRTWAWWKSRKEIQLQALWVEERLSVEYSTILVDEPLRNVIFDILMGACPDFVVLDKEGTVCGVLRRNQITKGINEGQENSSVSLLMEAYPLCVDERKSLKSIMQTVWQEELTIDWLPVLKQQKVVGILPVQTIQLDYTYL